MAVGAPIDGRTEGRQLLAWLYLTATRLALDALRQGRWVAADVSEVPLASCVASALDVAAARSLIVALCGRATPGAGSCAAVRVDGLSQPEVALVLGVSERSVSPRPDLERHVTACTLCAGYLAELEQLAVVGARPWVAPAAAPRSLVVRGPSRRVPLSAWAALAALVVLVVGYVSSQLYEDESYVAVKGSPAVQLLLRRAGRTLPWDRLSWTLPLPAYAYRLGEYGSFESISRAARRRADARLSVAAAGGGVSVARVLAGWLCLMGAGSGHA